MSGKYNQLKLWVTNRGDLGLGLAVLAPSLPRGADHRSPVGSDLAASRENLWREP